jgi:hypothetical protein
MVEYFCWLDLFWHNIGFWQIKKNFKLKDNIVAHENLDPKSGTEKGFIDKLTGEGPHG